MLVPKLRLRLQLWLCLISLQGSGGAVVLQCCSATRHGCACWRCKVCSRVLDAPAGDGGMLVLGMGQLCA